MSNNYSAVFRFKWSEKKAVPSFRTSETTFPTTNFHIFNRASDCNLFSSNLTYDLSPWLFFSFSEIFFQIVGILLFAVLWRVHAHALDTGINLKYTYRLLYWGGNLSPHFVWVWGLGFTQTYISEFLLFGPWRYQETKYRGHLELS
jgi:hypothetical protein